MPGPTTRTHIALVTPRIAFRPRAMSATSPRSVGSSTEPFVILFTVPAVQMNPAKVVRFMTHNFGLVPSAIVA
jgi:hypothetical protein